jgi:hypothetical protein
MEKFYVDNLEGHNLTMKKMGSTVQPNLCMAAAQVAEPCHFHEAKSFSGTSVLEFIY